MKAIVGGSVLSDGYRRLEEFTNLEKNHVLDDVKRNPNKYDSMLVIDVNQFKDSDAFKAHLRNMDIDVDKGEAMFIGWLLVFISDLAMMSVCFIRYVLKKINNHQIAHK